MAAATSLVFNIIGNNQASSALSSVGESVDGLGDKVKKWGLAAAAGVAAVGVAAVSFGVSAVNAASDLNETMSKSSAIFGDQAADIAAWGDTAAKTMGLSKAAALAAAAGFGDMFTQLGFGGDVAADMSKDVVQMAADLGSFNNLGTDDVADRLSAAFRGEYDSLQALIPNINAARVEQEAMAASGKANASELTAQEKAAAVLAIVHADGSRAAGDFAKTSNGLANQQKILSASFEDVKAKVGTALLPILTKLGTFAINTLLPGLQSLSNTITGFLGPALNGLTAGFTENDVTSTGLFGKMEQLGVTFRSVATWVQGTLVPALIELWGWVQDHIIPAVVDLYTKISAGLASAFDTIKGKIEENKPQLEQLWGWFVTLAGFITDYVVPAYATYLKGALEVAGVAIGVVIDAIGWLVDRINEMVPQVQGAANAVVAAWQWISDAATNTKQWVVDQFNGVVSFLQGMPQAVANALSNVAAFIAAPFIDAYYRVVGWVDKIMDKARSIASLGGTFGDGDAASALGIDPSTGLPARANGGPVSRGTAYWVGERGAEVFVPKQDGSIVPTNKVGDYTGGSPVAYSAAAMGGGGNVVHNHYYDFSGAVVAGPDAEQWFVTTSRKAVQSRGGNVSVLAG